MSPKPEQFCPTAPASRRKEKRDVKANDETKKKTETPEAEAAMPAEELESVSGGGRPFFRPPMSKNDTTK